MDEVARERAATAHARLDGINGQIDRLGREQQRTRRELSDGMTDTREGIYEAIGKVWDAQSETAQAVAEMKGTFGTALKVGGAIAVAVLASVLSMLGLLLTHRAATRPQQAPPRKATAALENATGGHSVAERLASRQRGAHERTDRP